MKRVVYILTLSLFILSSCCGGGAEKEAQSTSANKAAQTEETVVVTEGGVEEAAMAGENAAAAEDKDAAEVKKAESCAEFLDKYEDWAMDYIELLEKFTTNTADPDFAQDYNKLSREYSSWVNEWFGFVECSEDVVCQERYNEINRKIEQKQNALRGV